MKRSEMIQILADNLYDTCIDRTEEQCKNTAEFILGIIECNGMLPPTNEEKSFKLLSDGQMTYQVNEWDDE